MQYTLSEASVTAELEEGTEGGGLIWKQRRRKVRTQEKKETDNEDGNQSE